MKRSFAWLLASVLLLSGCSMVRPQETTPPETTAPPETEPPAFVEYQPAHSVEVLTRGAVSRYRIEGQGYYGMVPLGEGILLLSGEETTTLTWLKGEEPPVVSTLKNCLLDPRGGFLETDQGFSYYDPNDHCLVFLDELLVESARITLPKTMTALPVLSEDGLLVYYYDQESLRCLELRSGISRLLKESSFPSQRVQSIHFDGQVLECWISDGGKNRTLFVSTQTGETLFETDGRAGLRSRGQEYYVNWYEGDQELRLFGTRGQTIQRLTPVAPEACLPLFGTGRMVTVDGDSTGTNLICYDAQQGNRLTTVRLAGIAEPVGMVAQDNTLWFVARDLFGSEDALYCWDTAMEQQTLEAGFITPYYTAESPDVEGLARCEEQAAAIAKEHGVRIHIWKDGVKPLPEGYSVTGEYVVSTYERYLPVLEKLLGSIPEQVFERLGKKSQNGKLTVSLVREIYGTNELGSLTLEQGVQYWEDGSVYLLLMMNDKLEQSFYHELFHAMDSYILTETQVYDEWDFLNPGDFAYDYSYITNEYRDPENYLQPQTRAFIDIYSMSYPKEDRARILEYAMMEGNAEYFTSDIMHRKLETLCRGIRSAFGLDSEEPYLWEQYQ